MPIRTRSLSTEAPVQEPARDYKSAGDAVLSGFANKKRAAAILYDEKSSKEIPLEDVVTLLRTPDNNANVDRAYRNRIRGKATAIRAFCVLCQNGQPRKVRTCVYVQCPMWPFRMGNNPLKGKL